MHIVSLSYLTVLRRNFCLNKKYIFNGLIFFTFLYFYLYPILKFTTYAKFNMNVTSPGDIIPLINIEGRIFLR